MALQFREPPEWLIQEYMNRKSPWQEASAGLQTALSNYLAIDESKRRNITQQREWDQREAMLKLQQEKNTREQGEYARQYEPASLPGAGGAYNQLSPQDFGSAEPTLTGDSQMRSMLTQSGGPATLGPSVAQPGQPPSLMDRFNKWKTASAGPGIGMGQNTDLAPAPQNYKEQANLDFANRFPQGLAGAKMDRFTNTKPLDDKRTFQEKQELYDNEGNPIGYYVFDTRTGKKEPRFYDENTDGVQTGPKVKPQIPAASVEKTAGQKGFLDLLSNIKKNYKPEFVGPIESRLRKAGQRYDVPGLGLAASEQGANFERDLADLRSAVINERTGAAVGERQEWDRLLELLPDDAKSDKDFLPKLASFEKRYAQIIANREEGFRKSKYRNQTSSVPAGMDSMSQEELERIAAGGE